MSTDTVHKTVGDIRNGDIDNVNELAYAINTIHRQTFEEWLIYPRELQLEYGIIPLIAGGCIRDTLLNQPVKGIDIFITRSQWLSDTFDEAENDNSLSSWWNEIAVREGWILEHKADTEYEFQEKATGRDIVGVYSYKHPEIDVPYNIIVMDGDKPSKEILGEFDFGICQIGINAYGLSTVRKEFVDDLANKTLTATRDQPQEQRQMRLARLQEKFPLYKYISDTIIVGD